MMNHKYRHIDGYHKAAREMYGHRVVATEKLDGSNFSVKVIPGKPTEYRSKSTILDPENPTKFFGEAVRLAQAREESFRKLAKVPMVFFFESFGRGIQKRIDYTHYTDVWPSENGRSIALIDAALIYDEKPSNYITHNELMFVAKELGLLIPPHFIFEELKPSHIEGLVASELAVEGWVLKAERNGDRVRNRHGELLQTKVKLEGFAKTENKKARTRKIPEPMSQELLDYVYEQVNMGRLFSIYSHGHDNLQEEMSDMRYLPSLVTADLEEENDPIFSNHDRKAIQRTVAKFLPELLKRFIFERNNE